MSIRTTTTVSRRAFQNVQCRMFRTSRAVFSSDLPPNPTSAEALGFTPQTNRQRQLPADLKIPITVSGQKDLFHGGGERRQPRQQHERRKEPSTSNDKRQPRAVANPETDADFFADSSAPSPSHVQRSTNSSGPPRSRRALKNVSLDVVGAETALPPDVQRRQRRAQSSPRGNKSNAASGSGPRPGSNTQRRSRDSGVNVNAREKRVMLPRRQLTLETMDHSSNGLFGRKKLIAGGRIAGSVGSGLSHARKVTSLRPASSIISLPASPIPVLTSSPSKATEQAIQAASWAAALNPSIGLRAKSRLSEVVASQLGR